MIFTLSTPTSENTKLKLAKIQNTSTDENNELESNSCMLSN